MEQTTNYNLNLPAYDDLADIEKINENTRIIDTNLKQAADKAEAALPKASYTAADILNKLKTVDGVNSGLDADLFKGQSVIPIANGGTGTTTLDNFIINREFITNSYGDSVNLNDVTKSGLYYIELDWSNLQNFPDIGNNNAIKHSFLRVERISNNTIIQTLIPCNYAAYNNYTKNIYYRIKFSTSDFTDWFEYITTNNINKSIQSALQSGGVSVVKSIQRGVITISDTNTKTAATISAVNTSKTFVIYTGFNTRDGISETIQDKPYLELTNSTTVTAIRRFVNTDQRCSTIVPYQVIEYY